MPKSAEDKNAVLKMLRSRSDKNDYKNPEVYFSERVRQNMAQIISEGKNIGVKNWGSKCSIARKKHKYSIQDVADLMELSHVSVRNQEKITDSIDVDPFYLECFALIYNEDPIDLLTGIDPNLIDVVFSVSFESGVYESYINQFLQEDESDEKLEFLYVLTVIARLNNNAFKALIDLLHRFPIFENVLKRELGAMKDSKYPEARAIDYSKIYTSEYAYAYYEAKMTQITSALMYSRSPRLEVLAQLTLLEQRERKFLQDILAVSQFLHGKSLSLRKDLEFFPILLRISNAPQNADITPKYDILKAYYGILR